jgi:ADP-heptose:LPS heptosyltransferase
MTTDVPPRRVLLVALDNLGDLVFASALAPPLRAAFPDATIDVWCKAYTAAVGRLIPCVTDVIAADPPWAVPKHLPRPPIGAFLKSVGEIRARRYEVALVTGAPWRTSAAVAAACIPVRIGLARHHNQHFLTHVLAPEDGGKPVVREQSRLLEPLGVSSPNPHYELDASRLDASPLRRELGSRFVALHPFASARDRCVAIGEWVGVADTLHTAGVAVLWIGMPKELAELRAVVGRSACSYVDQIGDATLGATVTALSAAAMVVGHDSGPMHVAAAFRVPVVGVFAPGQPERTFPQGLGPWRMITRPSPAGITAETMLREMDALGVFSSA